MEFRTRSVLAPSTVQLLIWLLLTIFHSQFGLALQLQGPKNAQGYNRRNIIQDAGLVVVGSIATQLYPCLPVQAAADAAIVDANALDSSLSSSSSSVPKSVPLPDMNFSGNNIKRQPEFDGKWSPTPTFRTKLGQTRIQARELSPLQQPPFSDQELYYASFLFGSWKVNATLKQKYYPYGTSFVPSTSLIEGSPRNRMEQVGSSTSYEMHYFSTLANTMKNQLTVQLGLGVPESKIIADRGYNAISISNAYHQLTPVQQVDWNPSQDPTQLSFTFGAQPLADDMRPLGPRRAQVYLTARQAEFGNHDNNENNNNNNNAVYACSEQSRSVTLATRTAIVSDTETITEYVQISPNHVKATSRIAVYLTPNPNSREGILWQQVGGKAVAFFDYELDMERILESFVVDGTREVQRACVLTPKGIVQCQ